MVAWWEEGGAKGTKAPLNVSQKEKLYNVETKKEKRRQWGNFHASKLLKLIIIIKFIKKKKKKHALEGLLSRH